MKRLFIDLDRCIGCGACATSCARVLGGVSSISYAKLGGQVEIPSACRHCSEAPCLNVCPREAISRDEDGVVVRNALLCVACNSCVIACPFGTLADQFLDHTAVKCDLCHARVERGLRPACVATCASGARSFEEIDEVTADQRRVLVGAESLGHNPYRRR